MSALTTPLGPALQGAWWQLRQDFGRVLGWTSMLALLGLTAVTGLKHGAEAALRWPALALVWLGAALLYHLRQQNHPTAARLVPGQLRSLRGAWAVAVALPATAAGVTMGLGRGDTLAWIIAAALALLIFGASLRWWWTWLILGGLGASAFWWSDTAAWGALGGALRQWHAQQPLSLALCAALVLPGLASLLPQAGDAAHRRQQARAAGRRSAQASGSGGQVGTAASRLMAATCNFLLPVWRARLLRRARPTPRSVLARAELALLGGSHWSAQVGGVLLVMLLLAALFGLLLAWTPVSWEQMRQAGALGMSIGIASACFNPLLGHTVALQQTRREQALLMLLPGMPRGAALNRALAQRQMLHVAAAAVLALLLSGALLGGPGLHWAALWVALLLPLSVSLWRDTARARPPGAAHWSRLTGAGLALGALFWPLHGSLGPWAVLALGVLLWLALMAWRWRQLQTWPQMLPVARHARTPR